MSVYSDINGLINYALERELVSPLDVAYIRNRLIDILGLSEFCDEEANDKSLCELLGSLCEFAAENGIIERTQTAFDLFDTRLMGELTPRPSEVVSKFCELYLESPKTATDWYYKFSQDTDYIRRYRIKKDVKWTIDTEYGEIDITINLAKPEKDPREIAKSKNMKAVGYPKCALCPETEGYAGRDNFPARQNHRIIPLELCGEFWNFQYSPYVYYNEHCILFNHSHIPMKVDEKVFPKLFAFIDLFPHYFIGSNAGLPIVGGSILAHEHFQGGSYTFAMERAEIEKEYKVSGFEDVKVGRVKWPMSVIRLSCKDKDRVCALASKMFNDWREYTDEKAFIFAETDGKAHNAVTPIARRRGDLYELDFVLRNNITTEERPMGVFHPKEKLHHIKKENIGLIEVMGLAILPSRLAKEFKILSECAEKGLPFDSCEEIKKHADWANEIVGNKRADESFDELFRREAGKVFLECLEDAGVFKRDEEGLAAFDRFMEKVARG